jgi:hypothetical protein
VICVTPYDLARPGASTDRYIDPAPVRRDYTSIKVVLSDDEGMGQKAYRNPACIILGCTGEAH